MVSLLVIIEILIKLGFFISSIHVMIMVLVTILHTMCCLEGLGVSTVQCPPRCFSPDLLNSSLQTADQTRLPNIHV